MARCKNCVVGLLGACSEDYCQTERSLLIEQAQEAAKRQGHTLGEFVKVKDYATWQARCERCGQLVTINLNPEPGELDICGEGATAACPEYEGEPEVTEQGEDTTSWYAELALEDSRPGDSD